MTSCPASRSACVMILAPTVTPVEPRLSDHDPDPAGCSGRSMVAGYPRRAPILATAQPRATPKRVQRGLTGLLLFCYSFSSVCLRNGHPRTPGGATTTWVTTQRIVAAEPPARVRQLPRFRLPHLLLSAPAVAGPASTLVRAAPAPAACRRSPRPLGLAALSVLRRAPPGPCRSPSSRPRFAETRGPTAASALGGNQVDKLAAVVPRAAASRSRVTQSATPWPTPPTPTWSRRAEADDPAAQRRPEPLSPNSPRSSRRRFLNQWVLPVSPTPVITPRGVRWSTAVV